MIKRALAIAALITATGNASALDIGGINVPDVYPIAGQSLVLNGAGIREKWMFDLYVSGLYLEKPNADASYVVAADENQSIRLHIVSDKITSERMISATQEGFEKSLKGNTTPLKSQIQAFMATFQSEIRVGDVFELTYLKGDGVHVSKNGKEVKTIPGLAFKQALFGIWLSDAPVQASLKQDMLGRTGH